MKRTASRTFATAYPSRWERAVRALLNLSQGSGDPYAIAIYLLV